MQSVLNRSDLPGERINDLTKLAEGVGFEPTELSLNGFQDRRLKPLGHPSQFELDSLASTNKGVNIFHDRDCQPASKSMLTS
jgi:hypothetical protein